MVSQYISGTCSKPTTMNSSSLADRTLHMTKTNLTGHRNSIAKPRKAINKNMASYFIGLAKKSEISKQAS
jgi:hypothetical protein